VVSFREDGGDLESPDLGASTTWDEQLRRLWDAADLLLFADAPMLERAVASGCPPGKAEVLGPPLIELASTAPGNDRARGPRHIVSSGPLIWEQGFEHSVHAVRLLLDMGIDCDYRIVGRGDHLDAVAFARHQLRLADRVELVSPDDGVSLVDEVRAADVFVDASVADTTSPTPLRTAQALGIPFVATPRDGLPADAGITVPRRNARAIAEGLARFAGDSGLRARMGEAGRARADRHPTLEEHLHRLQELYRRALA
jgi:colanic acid/amylovoran biosynthesis glycosyltransferase